MARSEYCLARAERLRMLMLTASDPAAEVRLREFVQKYRELAERTKKQVESPPSNLVRFRSSVMPPRDINDPEHWRGRAAKIRALALTMKGTESDILMSDLVTDYDKLADRAA